MGVSLLKRGKGTPPLDQPLLLGWGLYGTYLNYNSARFKVWDLHFFMEGHQSYLPKKCGREVILLFQQINHLTQSVIKRGVSFYVWFYESIMTTSDTYLGHSSPSGLVLPYSRHLAVEFESQNTFDDFNFWITGCTQWPLKIGLSWWLSTDCHNVFGTFHK